MTTLLRCVNGHEYDASSSSGSKATVCPVCGAAERPMPTSPTLPEPRPALPFSDLSLRHTQETPPVLAGYEVLEEIGHGGMGVVYRARQRDTGRIVALKVIRKERLGSPDMVARFRREAQASGRLQHPNVVEVYASDLAGDTHYLAMEYVPGVTLQRLVEQTGPLPLAQACDFVRQAALGLAHAHEKGLVHRDIKPANLMVVAPAGLPLPPRPMVKVLDMGVARLFQLSEQEPSLTTLTRDGSVIGTPDYIAPEQLEDPRSVDIRADLYSLGCTFYYLLTGQVPFPGGTLVQKLDRQRWHTAPGVNQLRPEIPPTLAAVVRRLMAKHPDDRYQTPADLAGALADAPAHRRIARQRSAGPDPGAAPAHRPYRRGRLRSVLRGRPIGRLRQRRSHASAVGRRLRTRETQLRRRPARGRLSAPSFPGRESSWPDRA